jgi:hypothetical protein
MDGQTFVFRVPANLPCYGDWNFDVYPGEFALYKSALVDKLTALIDQDRRHWIAMWLFGAGWYRDYKTHLRLRDILQDKCRASELNLEPYPSTIWIVSSDAIFSRHFDSYLCPECNVKYSPEEGTIIDWRFGKSLAAHGGRRFACPRSHTVYSIMEWLS